MKKSLLLLGTLPLLAACGNSANKPAGPQPITSLSGKIQNWTAGTGTLELHSTNAANSDGVIGTGSIAADGTISGTLPTASQVGGYLHPIAELTAANANCTSTIKASNSANYTAVTEFVATANGNVVGSVLPGGTGSGTLHPSGQTLIYADQAVSVNGQESCPATGSGQTTNVTVALNLAAGWNVVNEQGTLSATSITLSLTSADKLADTWSLDTASATSLGSKSVPQLLQRFLR